MFFKILFINWNHGVLILLINWIHEVFFIRLSFKLSDWLNILCTLCTVSLICYLIGWISSALSLCPATWLAKYLSVLLPDWLNILWTVSLSCYLTGWISSGLSLCPANWLAAYLSVLLPDWLNISMSCYPIGWISSGLSLCPATWLAEYPLDCLSVHWSPPCLCLFLLHSWLYEISPSTPVY